MPGVEGVQKTSHLPIDELEMETRRLTPVKETVFQKDTVDKKADEAQSSSKISQTLASFWQWITSLFGKEAAASISNVNDETKVDSVEASQPLVRPREIAAKEAERLMEELRALLNNLNTQAEQKRTGSVDEALLKQYRAQSEIYEDAVLQGREKFAFTQMQKKQWEKGYIDVRKEYDKIGQDSQWWQKANTYALYAVAAVTAVVAVYAFGTARAGQGLSDVFNAVMKVGGTLIAGTSAVSTIVQTNLGYRATIKQGDMEFLRHKNWMSDVSLRGTIDFLSDQYTRHNQQFVNMKDIGDTLYQTTRSFYS